jgi:CGNR zinc finger
MEIPLEELEPSRAQGFATLWAVFGGYEITGGVLRRARDDMVRCYAPLMHREIPGELMKLKRGDEAAVIRFAMLYGPLGYAMLVPPDENLGGDPVEWIWAHAETLEICSHLTYLLQEDQSEKVKPYLRSLPSWPVIMQATKGSVTSLGITYDEKDSVRLAHLVRRNLINANIDGIYPQLAEDDGKDRILFRFRALIEVAYWHLANAVVTGHVKRCESPDCGALFVQTDPRERYCPPRFRQPESSCAVRARVRRFRERNEDRSKRRTRQASRSQPHKTRKVPTARTSPTPRL